MVDHDESLTDGDSTAATQPDSVTRGFPFADLRSYTDFVETHGAASAAALLVRFRMLARTAIARFGGAEIKTEGDSFYVVFSSVSSAVRCGLAITSDAEAASSEHPDERIRVGVGIHAGETVESDDGYVGSPVNIAARICALAAPFAAAYRARYGEEPDEYAAAAYACVEVIVASLRAIAQTGPEADHVREALRAHAADPGHRYETVLGTVGFDSNGDSIQQFVTFFRGDPAAADGAGDWVSHTQQDFGPAP